MTLTRALRKYKTLTSKINKQINESSFVNIKVGGKEKFECDPKADYKSVMDLIEYKTALKKAIIKANAETVIKISGKKMTIAEAIHMRYYGIEDYKHLLRTLEQQYHKALSAIDRINEEVQARIDNVLSSAPNSTKKDEKEVRSITESFQKLHGAELSDPLKIEEKIKELREFIETFEDDIDVALSEANSSTKIDKYLPEKYRSED